MLTAWRLSIYGRIEHLADERYEVVRGDGTYGRAAYGGVRFRFDRCALRSSW